LKDLQEGLLYRRERATPKHRDLYDVLEENLVAGNQELESDMTFFATAERKERTFGEWTAGVLGLWNVVEIHQVKKMVEGTKKGLMIEVHHVDTLWEYADATQDDLSKLAKRISEQATFLWGRMEEISSKAAVNDDLRPIRAISRIATTITAHRLDRAVMDLVNVQKVFSEYAERLEEDSWYIELDRWQDVFHLEASYHASADTLTLAVRLPLLRRESRGYDLYSPTFFPIMHGLYLYDIRTVEKIFAWEKATESYLNLDVEALSRSIQAGNKYFCNEAKVVMPGVTTDMFSGSVAARVEWHKVNVPPLGETCHFVSKEDQLHAHGGDGARGHGGPGAVPRESKAGKGNQRTVVAGNERRLQSVNLKLGDRRQG
jgi:hypothetical protein